MKVRAVHFSRKITVRSMQRDLKFKVISRDPLLIELTPQKFVVLFRYGLAVFWNLTQAEINKFLKKVKPYSREEFEEPFTEDLKVTTRQKKDSVDSDGIELKTLNNEKIVLISEAIARSVALDYFEYASDEILQEFEEVTVALSQTGKTKLSSKSLLKKVGFAMQIQNLTVGQMAMLDKPDITWEDEELNKLYQSITTEYEIEERYQIVYQKLEMIFRDIEFIMNYIENRRTFYAEVIIVVLIVIEIVIFIFELTYLS